MHLDFSSEKTAMLEAVTSLQSYLPQTTTTNLNGAIVDAVKKINNLLSSSVIAEAAVIIFTDGTDTASSVRTSDAARDVQQSKAHVYTIREGNITDEAFLNTIGKSGSYAAPSYSELDPEFASLATKLSLIANSTYLFKYCSPKVSSLADISFELFYKLNEATAVAGFNFYRRVLQFNFDSSTFKGECGTDAIAEMENVCSGKPLVYTPGGIGTIACPLSKTSTLSTNWPLVGVILALISVLSSF
jgi:hypothetical protein